MAGSRTLFEYVNDAGVLYTVNIDESNAEATCGGIPLFTTRTVQSPDLPARTTKRYINATLLNNPDIKRRFWIGNPQAVVQAVNGATLLAQVYPTSADAIGSRENWVISSYRGEKSSVPIALNAPDTGLIDGDGLGGGGG